MKKDKKLRNIKLLIGLLILIVIILVICILITYNNPADKNLRYIYDTNEVGVIDIMPTNVDKLFTKYQGTTDQRSIYKALDWFMNDLVEKYYLETKSLDEIDSYYNENKDVIERELGLVDAEKFNEFCENLKNNLKTDKLELVSYTINPDSIKNGNALLECTIIAKYNDNQKIGFRVLILNSATKTKTPIRYQACKDEKYLEYEYVENDYQSNDIHQTTGRVIK